MNIEDYREYFLSLDTDVEEKLPFQKFKSGEGVLVFYVSGHMFSFLTVMISLTETIGGFTGVVLGLFAQGKDE